MPFPVAEQFIAETERKLGAIFSSAFRARMSRNNGGELSTKDDTCFRVNGASASSIHLATRAGRNAAHGHFIR